MCRACWWRYVYATDAVYHRCARQCRFVPRHVTCLAGWPLCCPAPHTHITTASTSTTVLYCRRQSCERRFVLRWSRQTWFVRRFVVHTPKCRFTSTDTVLAGSPDTTAVHGHSSHIKLLLPLLLATTANYASPTCSPFPNKWTRRVNIRQMTT